MDLTIFRSVVLIFLFVAFCLLVLWAWSPRRKQAFDEAARLAVEEDGISNNNTKEIQP